MTVSTTPNRSKCLRALRKVYPHAQVEPLEGGGLQLTYRHPSGERVPVLECVPAEGSKPPDGVLVFAVLKTAFRRLGFETSFKGSGLPFEFTPIKKFEGPEEQLPVELDTSEPMPTVESGRVSYEGATFNAPMPAELAPEAPTSTELLIPVTPEDVP